MSASAPALPNPRSPLERALGVVAEVRAGEAGTALLLTLNFFLLQFGYYIFKTVRESLILTQAGATGKAYTAAVQAVLLLFLVPAFGAFASRVNRVKLITGVTLLLLCFPVLFMVASRAGVRTGIAYFVWVGIFNTLGIAQFWAFVNDVYTKDQGKRLIPMAVVGASLGAWLGAEYAGRFIKTAGPYVPGLIACGIVAVCIVIVKVVSATQVRTDVAERAAEAEKPLGKEGGFELIRKDRYLLLIASLIVVLNLVNTTGEYVLGSLVERQAEQTYGAGEASVEAREKFIGGFFGKDYFSKVNLVGFLVQLLLVSRIIKYIGVGGALFIHPLIALVGYGSAFFTPSLAFVRNIKILDNATDYSLNNTLKQALWLPTSREAKYKAKAAVDSFFMRSGDVLSAGLVYLGSVLAFTLPVFAAVNVGLAAVWLVIVTLLSRENRKRMASAAPVS
ncbi:MAG TPA: Npt1/Npt2 family nucleotide transporter [Vicinamibacteria bacterium]